MGASKGGSFTVPSIEAGGKASKGSDPFAKSIMEKAAFLSPSTFGAFFGSL